MTEAKWSDFSSLDGQRMLAAASQLLPKWVALLLAVVIAVKLAEVVWMVIPGSATDEQLIAPRSQANVSSTATGNQVDVQTIANAHLFGEARAEDESLVEAAPLVEDHENLAETRLNLSLKGTIASGSPDASLAIIADASNDEKIYAIDDTVIAGTTLHAVYADRVVLNRGGTLEILKLPKEFPQGSQPVRRNTTNVSRAAGDARSIQNVVSQNVTRLADVIRPTPYFVSGQMQGYRVYPGRNRKQFAALGLRPGDLIKDIDGAALTNPQQATQIFQSLGSTDQVSVTVERNGQPETIILKTNQLNLGEDQ